MKKNLVLLIALAFMGSSLSIPAFAAVKSGAICKNQGQVKTVSGYKYTCKKTGNKLVWIKGVKVSAKVTKPSVSTPTPSPTLAGNIIDKCLGNISDSRLTKEIFLSIVGLTEEELLRAVTNNSWYITLATNSGEFGVNHYSSPDIYCGNAQDNYVKFLDSSAETKDYFFGGAGNDRVETAWNSEFFGGDGNDSVVNLLEKSIFYGGDGNDLVSNMASDAKFLQETSTVYSRTKTLLETQLSKAFKSELVRDLPFTLVIENPNLSQKNRFLIEEFKKHLRWLSGMGANEKRPFYVIYADTADWMNDEFKRQGCEFPPGYKLPLGGFAISADCAGKYIVTRPNADREAHESSIQAQHGLIHEAFHLWQNQLVRTGASEYGRLWGLRGEDWPHWIVEGGANAFSRYAFWYTNGAETSPEQIMKDWFKEDWYVKPGNCVGVNIRDMVSISNNEKGRMCGYSTGQVAIDLFIEKFGVNSFYALLRSPKSPGYGDFPGIFRTVTGQEVEAFYDEVDKEMKLRGWS